MSRTYRVDGMTCDGCAASVTRALQRIGLEADVDHERGTATVAGHVDDAEVRRVIEAAGFVYEGVRP